VCVCVCVCVVCVCGVCVCVCVCVVCVYIYIYVHKNAITCFFLKSNIVEKEAIKRFMWTQVLGIFSTLQVRVFMK